MLTYCEDKITVYIISNSAFTLKQFIANIYYVALDLHIHVLGLYLVALSVYLLIYCMGDI